MSEYETLKVEIEGGLALVTIAREAQRNALSAMVLRELSFAASALEGRDDVRVVALTGAGDKAFVAGADISEMATISPRQAQSFAELGGALMALIEQSTKPWVAAVNGVAFGGGCELALACDFIYAADTAQLGQPEVKLGVIPGFGGTQRLARRVGVAKAKELCLTGDAVTAAEALRIGLVDATFPAGELLGKVRALAARIAANGPLAVAACKRLIHEGQSLPLPAALVQEQQAFGLLFATEDQKEGMAAFLAKPRRAPAFKGE